MAVIAALLVVALVPPWRNEALTTALLVTGQIGAPRDLRTVALCAYRRRGLGAWLARRIVVPRGRVVAGTIAGAALHGARRPYYAYLPPGYDLPLFRRVFTTDANWRTLTPRLAKVGLLPDDPKLIERIVAVGK